MKNKIENVIEEVGKIFVGKQPIIEKTVTAMLASGHVILEDTPGTGKTLLMKLFSRLCDVGYKRIQGTAELLPSDILGGEVWDAASKMFKLINGPVFTNILLFDEINRVPPKTLSALLEVSEERQVTIGGETFKMSDPFFLLATQNPIEFEGTWVLPEAQVDRFLLQLSLGYPDTLDDENMLLTRRIEWRAGDLSDLLKPILTAHDIVEVQRHIEEKIYVDLKIINYISQIVRGTREHEKVELGASSRGSLSLLKVSRAYAFVRGRDFVVPDDVKYFAVDALSHRITVKMDYAMEGTKSQRALQQQVVQEVLDSVPVPKGV